MWFLFKLFLILLDIAIVAFFVIMVCDQAFHAPMRRKFKSMVRILFGVKTAPKKPSVQPKATPESSKGGQPLTDTTGLSRQIQMMEERHDQLVGQVEQLSEAIRRLQRVPTVPKTEAVVVETTPTIVEEVPHGEVENTLADMVMYAYTASSASPFGFTDRDWTAQADRQVFMMERITDDEALLDITDFPSVHTQIINNIAYLEKIIEYENTRKGAPRNVRVVEAGLLKRQGEVWTIKKKIKLKFV